MRRRAVSGWCLGAWIACLSSATVQAQSAQPSNGATPTAPPEAAAMPAEAASPAPDAAASTGNAPPPATSPLAAAEPRGARGPVASCILGSFEGVPLPDARTSAALVCQALREQRVSVMPEPVSAELAPPNANAYRVSLRRLGYVIVLDVAFESPLGTRGPSRTLQLAGVEEVTTAAPRIAESLARGTPLESTAKVHTLVGQETHGYAKEFGETKAALGILAFALPDDTYAGYGAFGRIYYETARFAVGIDMRIGGSSGDASAFLFGISVGGRYFLNEANTSPFVGGGFGILWLSLRKGYTAPPGSSDPYLSLRVTGSGPAAFGELGVEFLRLHHARFELFLRVDAPLYSEHSHGYSSYGLPISLMAAYSFE